MLLDRDLWVSVVDLHCHSFFSLPFFSPGCSFLFAFLRSLAGFTSVIFPTSKTLGPTLIYMLASVFVFVVRIDLNFSLLLTEEILALAVAITAVTIFRLVQFTAVAIAKLVREVAVSY